MKPIKLIRTFNDRYPLVGPSFWMLSVQYFIVQIVVAKDWATSYSISQNTISDLGNTACGLYNGRQICSPLHDLMNASFIVLGISMTIGAALIYHEFQRSRVSRIGFTYMALAGVGTLLVGLFPENTIARLHLIGAALPFLLGNLGLVVLGIKLALNKGLKIYSILSGGVALIALVLYVTSHYLGLGQGGMERLVAYPQTIWLIVFGIYMSSNHYRKQGV